MRDIVFASVIAIAATYLTPAHGADYSLRFGPSVQAGAPDGSAKLFGLRREAYQFYGVYLAEEIGGFVDNGGKGRSGSGFGSVQLGVEPGAEVGMYGKAFLGPCVITARDSQLGGFGQFCSNVGLGMRDQYSFLGVNYVHMSSAGLAMPNHGRDWLVFEMGLRF
jgi:hypothetical protein